MQFKQIVAEDNKIIAYFDNLKLLPSGLSADLSIIEKKTGKRITMKVEGVKFNLWELANSAMNLLTGRKKVNKTEIFAKTMKSVFGLIDMSLQDKGRKEIKK